MRSPPRELELLWPRSMCLFDSNYPFISRSRPPSSRSGRTGLFFLLRTTRSPFHCRLQFGFLLLVRQRFLRISCSILNLSRLWYSLLRAVLTPAQTISESRQSTLGYGIASAVPHLDSARLDYRGPAHRVRQNEPGTVRWLLLLASKRPGREKYPIEKRPGFLDFGLLN